MFHYENNDDLRNALKRYEEDSFVRSIFSNINIINSVVYQNKTKYENEK
jgi:hypothetical protein